MFKKYKRIINMADHNGRECVRRGRWFKKTKVQVTSVLFNAWKLQLKTVDEPSRNWLHHEKHSHPINTVVTKIIVFLNSR